MAAHHLPVTPALTIASWNVGIFNPISPAKIIEKIGGSHWDILCLQEVSPILKDRLVGNNDWAGCSEQESVRTMPDGSLVVAYSMILVRAPAHVVSKDSHPFHPLGPPRGRKKFLIDVLTKLKSHDGVSKDNTFLYADIEWGKRKFRVLSVHFQWASDRDRDLNWQSVSSLLDSDNPNLVAGDLNLFDTFRGAILNWFLLGRASGILNPKADRKRKERDFRIKGLRNPLRGQITHKKKAGKQQLDHILVNPMQVEVLSASAEGFDSTGKFSGSDHAPVSVRLRFLDKARSK
jgi:endonuclease/exonuclease/phosphatase family metal-dependent hydrolase